MVFDPPGISQSRADARFATVVRHGLTATTARPSAAVRVYWSGQVRPVFAIEGDLFHNLTAGSLQVRTDSGWSPTAFDPLADVTWHSVMWADAMSGQANGSSVSTAVDASGNGHDWTQATPSAQPQFLRKRMNGRSVLYFDGTPKRLLGPTLPATLAQPFSFYAVAQIGGSSQRIVTYSNGSTSFTGLGVSSGGLLFTSAGSNVLGAARGTGVQRFAAIHDAGSTGLLHVEGTDTSGTVGSAVLSQLAIGSDNPAGNSISGFIAFVGVKAGRLTSAEIASLDAWALAYYGITNYAQPANEAWSWWTRPRAVAINGKTYVGTTSARGEVIVNEYVGNSDKPVKYVAATLGGPPTMDDHNNPALVIQPGKPLIAIYSKHDLDNVLHWRKSTVNIEQGIVFGTEKTKTLPGNTTYAAAHVHGNNIWVMHRSPSTTVWGLLKSTDWGESFNNSIPLITTSTYQFYCASVRYGTDTLRIAVSTHPINGTPPDQNIYYCEVNLSTGAVTKSDGTVLGNLDGTNLPVSIASLDLVATPAAGQVSWVYDVSDAPNPEVAWVSFDPNNIATTSAYKYSRRAGTAWQAAVTIVAAGNKFSGNAEPYLAGAQFSPGAGQGVIYLARENAGTWTVEKRITTDNGATWTTTVLDTTAGTASTLTRAWATERRDGTVAYPAWTNENTRETSYNDFDSHVRGVGTPT